MKDKVDIYELVLSEDGTYEAITAPIGKELRIVIPEEYNGIPITKISVRGPVEEPAHTICVSKNVKIFMNTTTKFQLNRQPPYYVEISPENPWLIADDKAVFSKDKKTLYAFTARKDNSYTIPGEVRVIYNNAFFETLGLKDLTLPDELDEVGDFAFCRCGIKELRLPKRMKKLGSHSFSVTSPDILVLPEDVEEMASNAFFGTKCSSPVYIPDYFDKPEYCIPNYDFAQDMIIDKNSKSFTVIDGVIYSKDMKALLAVTSKAPSVITVPDGVEVIGSNACIRNKNIREMILPNSVRTILSYVFSSSTLEKINLENVKIIESNAFTVCQNLLRTGKIGAEEIGDYCFDACSSLTELCFTNVREIGDCALSGLRKCNKIFLPEGLEKIGFGAFGDSLFKTIRIPRSASGSDNFIADSALEIELYDVENSVIYKKVPNNNFGDGCLVKVLSPDTDEIKFAVKIFGNKDRYLNEYISSLFGGEQFFDLKKYDEYFEIFCGDYFNSKYEAAYYRIKYPVNLTDHSREIYAAYLEKYASEYFRTIIDKPDVTVEEIADFPYLNSVKEPVLLEFITLSANRGLIEITSFLMNYKHEHFPNINNDGDINDV
ncbi:MAG: leucine-rich repeat domain-containing protein [Oscillospiraceae bacterium]|nr:leucine-rich repeat domain-containing protein [Oscillospiraceae bacterium]